MLGIDYGAFCLLLKQQRSEVSLPRVELIQRSIDSRAEAVYFSGKQGAANDIRLRHRLS